MRTIKKSSLIIFKILVLIAISFLYFSRADAEQFSEGTNKDNVPESWEVDMVGFNYTNRVIDGYSVNGEGAGNVLLSSRTSGGGKSVCCITISHLQSGIARIRVRWQVDGCTYLTRSKISGEVFENVFPYYKQADLALPLRKNSRAQHLEVHFYPDGSVNAQLTESLSLPRISLDGQRPDISNFPRCHDDKKPK